MATSTTNIHPEIKLRWCRSVACRAQEVWLVLTSVTGTRVRLTWLEHLGWYEAHPTPLPLGLHTGFILIADKVWESVSRVERERDYPVEPFHIVPHKFAVDLFLRSEEPSPFWNHLPQLRQRYLSSDPLYPPTSPSPRPARRWRSSAALGSSQPWGHHGDNDGGLTRGGSHGRLLPASASLTSLRDPEQAWASAPTLSRAFRVAVQLSRAGSRILPGLSSASSGVCLVPGDVSGPTSPESLGPTTDDTSSVWSSRGPPLCLEDLRGEDEAEGRLRQGVDSSSYEDLLAAISAARRATFKTELNLLRFDSQAQDRLVREVLAASDSDFEDEEGECDAEEGHYGCVITFESRSTSMEDVGSPRALEEALVSLTSTDTPRNEANPEPALSESDHHPGSTPDPRPVPQSWTVTPASDSQPDSIETRESWGSRVSRGWLNVPGRSILPGVSRRGARVTPDLAEDLNFQYDSLGHDNQRLPLDISHLDSEDSLEGIPLHRSLQQRHFTTHDQDESEHADDSESDSEGQVFGKYEVTGSKADFTSLDEEVATDPMPRMQPGIPEPVVRKVHRTLIYSISPLPSPPQSPTNNMEEAIEEPRRGEAGREVNNEAVSDLLDIALKDRDYKEVGETSETREETETGAEGETETGAEGETETGAEGETESGGNVKSMIGVAGDRGIEIKDEDESGVETEGGISETEIEGEGKNRSKDKVRIAMTVDTDLSKTDDKELPETMSGEESEIIEELLSEDGDEEVVRRAEGERDIGYEELMKIDDGTGEEVKDDESEFDDEELFRMHRGGVEESELNGIENTRSADDVLAGNINRITDEEGDNGENVRYASEENYTEEEEEAELEEVDDEEKEEEEKEEVEIKKEEEEMEVEKEEEEVDMEKEKGEVEKEEEIETEEEEAKEEEEEPGIEEEEEIEPDIEEVEKEEPGIEEEEEKEPVIEGKEVTEEPGIEEEEVVDVKEEEEKEDDSEGVTEAKEETDIRTKTSGDEKTSDINKRTEEGKKEVVENGEENEKKSKKNGKAGEGTSVRRKVRIGDKNVEGNEKEMKDKVREGRGGKRVTIEEGRGKRPVSEEDGDINDERKRGINSVEETLEEEGEAASDEGESADEIAGERRGGGGGEDENGTPQRSSTRPPSTQPSSTPLRPSVPTHTPSSYSPLLLRSTHTHPPIHPSAYSPTPHISSAYSPIPTSYSPTPHRSSVYTPYISASYIPSPHIPTSYTPSPHISSSYIPPAPSKLTPPPLRTRTNKTEAYTPLPDRFNGPWSQRFGRGTTTNSTPITFSSNPALATLQRNLYARVKGEVRPFHLSASYQSSNHNYQPIHNYNGTLDNRLQSSHGYSSTSRQNTSNYHSTTQNYQHSTTNNNTYNYQHSTGLNNNYQYSTSLHNNNNYQQSTVHHLRHRSSSPSYRKYPVLDSSLVRSSSTLALTSKLSSSRDRLFSTPPRSGSSIGDLRRSQFITPFNKYSGVRSASSLPDLQTTHAAASHHTATTSTTPAAVNSTPPRPRCTQSAWDLSTMRSRSWRSRRGWVRGEGSDSGGSTDSLIEEAEDITSTPLHPSLFHPHHPVSTTVVSTRAQQYASVSNILQHSYESDVRAKRSSSRRHRRRTRSHHGEFPDTPRDAPSDNIPPPSHWTESGGGDDQPFLPYRLDQLGPGQQVKVLAPGGGVAVARVLASLTQPNRTRYNEAHDAITVILLSEPNRMQGSVVTVPLEKVLLAWPPP